MLSSFRKEQVHALKDKHGLGFGEDDNNDN
jgi:hypothetical protein